MSSSAAAPKRKRGRPRKQKPVPAQLPVHQTNGNDDSNTALATKRSLIRLSDVMEQWKLLLDRNATLDQLLSSDTSGNQNDSSGTEKQQPAKRKRAETAVDVAIATPNKDANDDPFDCSDVAATSVFQKAEELIPSFVHAWKQLDERRDTAASMVEKTDNAGAWWFDRHVRLPENFDYTTSKSTSPPPADDPTQDQVVSLDDPTRTTSYTHELWKIFHSIPTSQEIEQSLQENLLLHNTKRQFDLIDSVMTDRGLFNSPAYNDDFGLYALRLSDRQGFSANFSSPSSTNRTSSANNKNNETSRIGSITWELWRNGPSRELGHPIPQNARMMLEFRHDQTLWNVHQAIVELTGDDFWTHHCAASNTTTKDPPANHDSDEDLSSPEDTQEQRNGDDHNNGFFFIEGTFYTTGNTCDYVQPIREWLSSVDNSSAQRLRDLGLGHISSVEDISVQPMASICLADLPVRLGMRYAHVHKGNCECSLFAIDLAYRPPATTPYPIVFDVWKPESTQAIQKRICEACDRRTGTLVCTSDTALTNGSKVLCTRCTKSLNLPLENLERLSVWHSFHEYKT